MRLTQMIDFITREQPLSQGRARDAYSHLQITLDLKRVRGYYQLKGTLDNPDWEEETLLLRSREEHPVVAERYFTRRRK